MSTETLTTNNNKHKIAICQLTCTDDINENFNVCKSLITDAKSQGAEVNWPETDENASVQ